MTRPKTATLMEAARTMAERRVGAVAVTDGSELAGLFAERDLLNRVVAAGKDPGALTLDGVMTPNPIAIESDRPLADALETMFEHGFRHPPVLNDAGNPIGVLSCRDVPAVYQVLRERWYPCAASANRPLRPSSRQA